MSQEKIFRLLREHKGRKFNTTQITEKVGGHRHNINRKCNCLHKVGMINRGTAQQKGRMPRYVYWCGKTKAR